MNGGLAHKEQKANRLYLAHLDIEEALNYLRALSELDDLPAEKRSASHPFATEAVFVATIIIYARSFVDSEARGMALPKIGPSIFKGEPDLKTLHKQVMDMRQQAIAHTDWRYHGVHLPEFAAGPVERQAWRPDYRDGLEPWKLFQLFTFANNVVVSQLIAMNVDVKAKPALRRAQHHHGPLPETLLFLA